MLHAVSDAAYVSSDGNDDQQTDPVHNKYWTVIYWLNGPVAFNASADLSLCALASLITLIISPKTLIYASFYFCIGRFFSNALLASLNARSVIRGQINDIDTNFHNKPTTPPSRLSRDVFARPGENLTATELSIHINQETQYYEDRDYGKLERPRSDKPSTVVWYRNSLSSPSPGPSPPRTSAHFIRKRTSGFGLPSSPLRFGFPPSSAFAGVTQPVIIAFRARAVSIMQMPNYGFRYLLCSRRRWIAALLIVALSLAAITLLLEVDATLQIGTPVEVNPPAAMPERHVAAPPGPVLLQVPELVGSSVYHPFFPPPAARCLANATIRTIKAHTNITDTCMDRWVSTGQWQDPCAGSMVRDAIVDLVYIWVNGSDPLHQETRTTLSKGMDYTTADVRFREHDELRYSLRAAHATTSSWPDTRWHVVTADVPHPDVHNSSSAHQRRLGLVPQWLDIDSDSQIFRLTSSPGTTVTPADASEWLDKTVPSLNSHAIESQLPQLDPEIVSDNMEVPIFRMHARLLVGGDASGDADGGGEWWSLGWSSHILTSRITGQHFGFRKRPYVQHNVRALSLPLMHEASLAFGSFFAATPLSQFRGSHNAPNEIEVNTIYMATHFVIERHREALLWSWIVGKWGGNLGMLDGDQKKCMWRELGGRERDTLKLPRAKRTSMGDLDLNMRRAGAQSPTPSIPDTGKTRYSWVSMDGYSASFTGLATSTTIKRSDCIGEKPELAWDMFRRVAKTDTQCGDDIIAALMHASTSGLSVFLPPPSELPRPPSQADPITLPLVMPVNPPPLPQNPRAFAVRLLMRYAYSIGNSPIRFIELKSATQAKKLLDTTRWHDITMLGINDDLTGAGRRGRDATGLRNFADAYLPYTKIRALRFSDPTVAVSFRGRGPSPRDLAGMNTPAEHRFRCIVQTISDSIRLLTPLNNPDSISAMFTTHRSIGKLRRNVANILMDYMILHESENFSIRPPTDRERVAKLVHARESPTSSVYSSKTVLVP
ncbi:hypothetical protein B0H11DRAFT_2197312 [Mycena galericulata]|nr:hypothetical protein B0H11DRAFT_2197312 [Mycena galericulata]